MGLPKISYMTCCYVKTKGSDRPAADEVAERYLFAERKIEGEFRKWNTNFGAVIRLTDDAMQELRERDEARGADGADGEDGGDGGDGGDGDAPARTRVSLVTDDVPQAFSHFSLFYSERPLSQVKGKGGVAGRCLACDLQGCFQKVRARARARVRVRFRVRVTLILTPTLTLSRTRTPSPSSTRSSTRTWARRASNPAADPAPSSDPGLTPDPRPRPKTQPTRPTPTRREGPVRGHRPRRQGDRRLPQLAPVRTA